MPEDATPVEDVKISVTVQVNQVIAHYKTFHPRARPGEKEKALIQSRLHDGYSVGDLCEAIDGCHRCPHNCGVNERGMKYQTVELIMRNASNVQRFLEMPKDVKPEVRAIRTPGRVHE